MKPADFRVCPNCDARNKSKWEFCVKCGEALQDVPLGEPAPDVTDPESVAEEASEPFPWGSLATTAALLAVGIFGYNYFREPAAAPPPELFSVGTLPASLPPQASPLSRAPGQQEYEEGLRKLNANDPAGARVHFAAAAAAAADNALFRHAHGVALWQTGAKAEAIGEYEDAVRLAPGNTTYRMNLAKALGRTGQTREALDHFQEVLQREPGNAEALQEGARIAASSNPAVARSFLERAVVARPRDLVLKQELAVLLEKGGDDEGAAALYQQILDATSEAHITRGLLAEIQMRKGQTEEAAELFRAGIAQHPDAPLLHRGLASVLERSGQLAAAIAEYREYARLAPNASDAQQLRERADRLEKKVAESAS